MACRSSCVSLVNCWGWRELPPLSALEFSCVGLWLGDRVLLLSLIMLRLLSNCWDITYVLSLIMAFEIYYLMYLRMTVCHWDFIPDCWNFSAAMFLKLNLCNVIETLYLVVEIFPLRCFWNWTFACFETNDDVTSKPFWIFII